MFILKDKLFELFQNNLISSNSITIALCFLENFVAECLNLNPLSYVQRPIYLRYRLISVVIDRLRLQSILILCCFWVVNDPDQLQPSTILGRNRNRFQPI